MVGLRPEYAALAGHLARRLHAFGPLDAGDIADLSALTGDVESHPRGSAIDPLPGASPRLVISGWVCQMRPHRSRRRQIFGFLLPGDVIGSFWAPSGFNFYRTVALTRVRTLSLDALVAIGVASPAVLHAVRRREDYARHFLFDHIMRLGARDAYSGLAHLLLELHGRLQEVGLAAEDMFDLPIGQRVLAQAMGLSVAHTNQTLKRLCADGLLEITDDRVRLMHRERLMAVAQFDDASPTDTPRASDGA